MPTAGHPIGENGAAQPHVEDERGGAQDDEAAKPAE